MQRSLYILIVLVAAMTWTGAWSFPVPSTNLLAQEEEERKPGPADLAEAIKIAEKHSGGKAAAAETVVRDGREVHEVRVLLDDGSVRTVRIEPDTGAIVPQERPQR
jgi:uncharacterized membrane protein YkoI